MKTKRKEKRGLYLFKVFIPNQDYFFFHLTPLFLTPQTTVHPNKHSRMLSLVVDYIITVESWLTKTILIRLQLFSSKIRFKVLTSAMSYFEGVDAN